MLSSAVEQVLERGSGTIQAYCRGLTDPLASAAQELGYQVGNAAHRAGHLVRITMPAGVDTEAVEMRLQERRILVSVRGQALRVAPHVCSREGDIGALIDVLHARVTE